MISRRPTSEGDKHAAGSTAISMSHIRSAQRRIDQLAHNLEVDALYIQFWRICQTATIEEQRQIWSGNYDRDPTSSTTSTNSNSIGNGPRSAKSRQESLYRAFNSPTKPKSSSPPRGQQDILKIPYGKPSTTAATTKSESKSAIAAAAARKMTMSTFTLHFLGQSHAKRLLQMHQYFEQVLGIPIGYNARIALLVAFSSRGDMITTLNLFRQWQERPSSPSSRGAQTDRGGGGGVGIGKEMYSVVIRGLIGRNFQDSERRSFYVQDDPASGIRNQGVTQVYTALELFYDLLRQGGTPSFETYHSLIVGLSTFKNDMEAAELLLDHMIVKKKRPYVQVLHVMCREYARRKDFLAVERIFGMLKEYGIRPRAVTCNVILRAIFQMSTLEALQYLGHTATSGNTNLSSPYREPGLDFEAMADQLKRQKVQHLREYMHENGTMPNDRTFSILCHGFGHMKSGFPDLQEVVVEMMQGPSSMEPSLVVLNSLLFAHLNHGKIRKAESILDQILRSFHPIEDSSYAQTPRRRQQVESPFRKQASKSTTNTTSALKEATDVGEHLLPRIPMVPGKGAFHALMLAYVEQGDITSMERIVDKMIQAQHQQRNQHYQRRQLVARLSKSSKARSQSSSSTLHHLKVDLEADEYTATIMLLGYLTRRDFVKVDLIQQQIRAHPDWRSSSLFLDRDENRQKLIDFVHYQSSKEIARRSLLQSATEEGDDDVGDSGQRSTVDDIKAATAAGTTMPVATKPLSGDLQGELDDDIEIDVTTLSAKLRGLMNSSPSTSPSSSS
ncbi:hypothetical protein BG015_002413 [Linnemannia schmuckeri]|uniref:Pentatricopeptide repeat-containing protein n=1 Tax=Linnemannia schmuckeri TaxID=64567 RepID=A0A9P5S3D9_9FUNG|nr:hypothetical protein BG015_002413 [Linnemannia schmuckeri]